MSTSKFITVEIFFAWSIPHTNRKCWANWSREREVCNFTFVAFLRALTRPTEGAELQWMPSRRKMSVATNPYFWTLPAKEWWDSGAEDSEGEYVCVSCNKQYNWRNLQECVDLAQCMRCTVGCLENCIDINFCWISIFRNGTLED